MDGGNDRKRNKRYDRRYDERWGKRCLRGYQRKLVRDICLLAGLCLSVAMALAGYGRFNSMADEGGEDRPILYGSIQIQPGDTLWGIAGRYHEGSGMTAEEYLEALRETNGLTQDAIHAGRYLTILYRE